MKILSEKEYQALLGKIDNTLIKETEKNHKEEVNSLKRKHQEEQEDSARRLAIAKEDNKITVERMQASIDTQIIKATEVLTKKIAQLELEKGNALKEVEILTKAFSNLGFDVKDMKGILDKLVEGIISKSKIQIIGKDT